MAREDRNEARTLIEALAGGDPGFSFAQAVLALRRMRAKVPEAEGDIGSGPVRFSFERSSRFPAGEVQFVPEQEGGRLQVPFFGVAGPLGPLPAVYADLIERESRDDEHALGSFLELFEGRLLELFFLAELRSRFWLQHAWHLGGPSGSGEVRVGWSGEDGLPFEKTLFALVGTSLAEVRQTTGLPPGAILHYAGLLAQRPVSMSALEAIVADFFGIPASIMPFDGQWLDVPEGHGSRLGADSGARVGVDLMLGDRFFDPQQGFRLLLGPMPRAPFEELLPGRPGARLLADLVRFAVGPELAWSYDVVLAAEDVHEAELSSKPTTPQRLGWSLWLYSEDCDSEGLSGPHGEALARAQEPVHAAG